MRQAPLISSETDTCLPTTKALESDSFEAVECRDADEASPVISAMSLAVTPVDADTGGGDPLGLCESIWRLPACACVLLTPLSDADRQRASSLN